MTKVLDGLGRCVSDDVDDSDDVPWMTLDDVSKDPGTQETVL